MYVCVSVYAYVNACIYVYYTLTFCMYCEIYLHTTDIGVLTSAYAKCIAVNDFMKYISFFCIGISYVYTSCNKYLLHRFSFFLRCFSSTVTAAATTHNYTTSLLLLKHYCYYY